MIRIKEDKCVKLSGITSLFVSFDFNLEVISVIKTSDKYIYNKKTKIWELPVTSLAYLLDELTYIDDIELELYKEDDNKEKYYTTLNYKIPPFKHQVEGIEWGLNVERGLLLDAPGAGKTTQMIYLAEELKAQKGIEHCLIICGVNALKSNWKKEINKFSNLSSRILGERVNSKGKVTYASINDRASELMSPIDAFFVIVNIETLRSDDIIKAFKTGPNKFDMIVVDEVHRSKNSRSIQGANLLKLSAKYMLGLTGTVILNNPLDAFVPLKWIGAEKSTLTNFKSTYCVFGGFGGHQIVGYKNLDLLKEMLQRYSLRRTKDEFADLPPKTVIKEVLEMDSKHRKFYEDVKDGVKEECDKIELKANNVLSLTTRLRQATSCPSALTSSDILSTKLERAVELVEEIVANGDKVLIMSTFKEPVYELQRLLAKYNPLIGTGDIPDDLVSKNNDLFQTDPNHSVFIGTVQKIGTGLTFNAANYAIFIDTPWTEALQTQAEDRIHRIGSTKPVFIYRLICEDTIDEVVDEIVETKRAFSDFIVDDIVNESTVSILRKFIEDL